MNFVATVSLTNDRIAGSRQGSECKSGSSSYFVLWPLRAFSYSILLFCTDEHAIILQEQRGCHHSRHSFLTRLSSKHGKDDSFNVELTQERTQTRPEISCQIGKLVTR